MCEPNHSIIQYPPYDSGGRPTESWLGKAIKDGILNIGKKLGDWWHYSRMGFGHSEAIAVVGEFSELIPHETRYEAKWWDRTVKLDGSFHGEEWKQKDAFDSAKAYANAVSIGSRTALRCFLKDSLTKTDRPRAYVRIFADSFLNRSGADAFTLRLKQMKLDFVLNIMRGRDLSASDRLTLISVMLGFTRKRNMLVPEWADDDSLWKPSPKLVVASLPVS